MSVTHQMPQVPLSQNTERALNTQLKIHPVKFLQKVVTPREGLAKVDRTELFAGGGRSAATAFILRPHPRAIANVHVNPVSKKNKTFDTGSSCRCLRSGRIDKTPPTSMPIAKPPK